MDYTYSVLAAEMLRRRNQAPVISSHEEELLCMKEQSAQARANQKKKEPKPALMRDRHGPTWLQRLVLGTGSH